MARGRSGSLGFLLTHEVELGGLDGFVDMTAVGGRIVYHRLGARF